MKDQLVGHFESNNLFAELQHAFRQGRSTVSAVPVLVTRVLDAFENKSSVALAFCDLSKAFDCVSHTVLLEKLMHYSIGGPVLQTLCNYLSDRQPSFSLGSAQSSSLPVRHGVSQGVHPRGVSLASTGERLGALG